MADTQSMDTGFEQPAANNHGGRQRSRIARWLTVVTLLLLLGLVAGELVLRFGMGLGDPVTYEPHATIEYLPTPNQTGERFGNRYAVNRYGMRSDDFEPTKQDNELRLLVLGDSVLFGGSYTDQADLPTEVARRQLQQQLDHETSGLTVTVANVSAGSWGPPNLLAFLEEHGPLDADAVVLVLSSHDASDTPDFFPAEDWPVDRPQTKPALALIEVFDRLIRPRLSSNPNAVTRPAGLSRSELDPGRAIPALDAIAGWCEDRGLPLSVVLYQTRPEVLAQEYEPGDALLRSWWRREHDAGRVTGPLRETREAFRALGEAGFRDEWHPSNAGNRRLGEIIFHAARDSLAAAGAWPVLDTPVPVSPPNRSR